jgi:hypothetical protein
MSDEVIELSSEDETITKSKNVSLSVKKKTKIKVWRKDEK